MSAIVTVPWPSNPVVGVALAASGVGGLGYAARVAIRTSRQKVYSTVWADWIWYVVLPAIAYFALALGGWQVRQRASAGAFLAAAGAVALLFIGIHNAWDTVTYVIVNAAESDAARTTN